jgi:CRP-like cAMP-binding protein
MDRYEFLKAFHPITPDDYLRLEEKMRTKKFKKGAKVIIPGKIQRELYFIKSGVQICYLETPHKPYVISFTYSPNICAIPESFSMQKPSKYTFMCLTDSEMDYLTYADLQILFDKSQQIERLFRKINETILANLLHRHLELRTTTIEDRFKAFCNRSPQLLHLVSHKYIASYLGIDHTNFSKLYNRVAF